MAAIMVSPNRPPATLFDAVADDDYGGMVKLYAIAARESALTFAAVRRRRDRAEGQARSSQDLLEEEATTTAEESKIEDDGYIRRSSSSSSIRERQQHDGDADEVGISSLLRQLDDTNLHLLPKRKVRQSLATFAPSTSDRQQVQVELDRVLMEAGTMLTNSPPPMTFSITKNDRKRRFTRIERMKKEAHVEDEDPIENDMKSIMEGNEESGEDSLCSAEEFEDDFIDDAKRDGGEEETEEESEDENEYQEEDNSPRIFDGAVANATPAGDDAGLQPQPPPQQQQPPQQPPPQQQQPHHLHTAGGGGSGTLLHLACALDSPFALAILLVMGGNVLSRHTAFRRLVVHEAASARSPNCLRLLLEIADAYRGLVVTAPIQLSEFKVGVGSNQIMMPSPESLGASNQQEENHLYNHGNGSFFLCPRGSNVPVLALAPDFAHSCRDDSNMSPYNATGRHTEEKSQSKLKSESEEHISFVEILELISDLKQNVSDGSMAEIDAARNLIRRISVPDSTKAAIVSMCSNAPPPAPHRRIHANSHLDFLNFPSVGLAATTDRPRGGVDGHGNTALHWASFKNASECVSVLLSHGADPNCRAEPSGWTPLHDASYSDASDCVDLLVKAGADVDSRANSGATPLCFAAQEDSPAAAKLLLEAGADPAARCAQNIPIAAVSNNHHQQRQPPLSRFSGYTPLHYCAHYNAHRACRILLEHEQRISKCRSSVLLETPDFNGRLALHVAVSRSSSDVLRELLHGGARIDRGIDVDQNIVVVGSPLIRAAGPLASPPTAPRSSTEPAAWAGTQENSQRSPMAIQSPVTVTPVSSPALRSMLPSRPISSSKPWNVVTQESINQCRALLRQTELSWSPERHSIFHPTDRRAVMELLRIGKRLEQTQTGIFVYDVWPCVLGFCGRGWFEPDTKKAETEDTEGEDANFLSGKRNNDDCSLEDSDFFQFKLE